MVTPGLQQALAPHERFGVRQRRQMLVRNYARGARHLLSQSEEQFRSKLDDMVADFERLVPNLNDADRPHLDRVLIDFITQVLSRNLEVLERKDVGKYLDPSRFPSLKPSFLPETRARHRTSVAEDVQVTKDALKLSKQVLHDLLDTREANPANAQGKTHMFVTSRRRTQLRSHACQTATVVGSLNLNTTLLYVS